MIPEAILTALFLGWALKGKFGRLADVHIQYGWMIFVPLGLYLGALGANYAHAFEKTSWVFAMVHVVGLLALMVVALANRQIAGVKLLFAGLAANSVAIIANGGFMPASQGAIKAVWGSEVLKQILTDSFIRHAIIDSGTRLAFLCDIIAARRPYVLMPSVYSVGDVLISIGGLIAIVAIMRTPLPSEQSAARGA